MSARSFTNLQNTNYSNSDMLQAVLQLIIEKTMTSGFEQVCTSPPIRLCVKSAAAVSSRSTGARKTATFARRITTALWELCLTREKESVCYCMMTIFHMFCNKDCCSLRVLMWVPFSVPVMHSVQRAVWPPATAWRPSSVKQGTFVNLLLSLLLF